MYGGPNRVPMDSLRLLWLSIMPYDALYAIAKIGVCLWEVNAAV